MQVAITITREGVKLPEYKTGDSACFDFEAAQSVEISPNERVLIPTGLVIETPKGYALIIAPRSSLPKTGLAMPHSFGIIDPDYCGPQDEIFIQVVNQTAQKVTVNRGDRVAQGYFVQVPRVQWKSQRKADLDTKNSRGGFGSTGR